MAADLNPGFVFDFGVQSGAAQAPWEFTGALTGADTATAGTSVDHKIQQHLSWKAASIKHSPTEKKRKRHSVELEESDSEESGTDSEDQPLPGEQDEDASSDDAIAFESDSADTVTATQSFEGAAESLSVDSSDDGGETNGIGEDDSAVDPDALQRKQQGLSSKHKAKADQPESSRPQPQQKRGAQPPQVPSKRQKTSGSADTSASFYAETPEGTSFVAQSFADLNLSRPLIKACSALGYSNPTPIQAACIPLALAGRDICGSAVTGSGKTAAFALPLLERLLYRSRRMAATYVLVLTPVRELAVQVHSMIQKLAQFTDVRAALVVGGLSLSVQAATLRSSPEVVVATPGRLIDHVLNSAAVGLEDLQALVLDEADRLLQMGFKEEVQEILRLAPRQRQTLLFSATMTEEVRHLATLSLRHPVRLAADAANHAPPELLQEVIRLKGSQSTDKEALLMALASRSFSSGRTIVFFRTKAHAHRVKILFSLANVGTAAELHGDMSQTARLESLDTFRKGEAAFLLATDVAARGLDIVGVETVVNFDCPKTLATYLHRVGRTARAGSSGRSVTLVEDGDRAIIKDVVKRTGAALKNRIVPQHAIAQWRSTIEKLSLDVADILQAERAERELRKAEMQAQKAENMMEHEAEIYARPARTWFQTEKQKREAAALAKAVSLGDVDGAAPGKSSKQAKNAGKLAEKEKRRAEAAKAKKRDMLMEDTKGVAQLVRAVKSRERGLRQEGMTSGKAGKAAAAAVTGKKSQTKAQKRKEKQDSQGTAGAGGGTEGLFSGDGLDKPSGMSHVYAGGGRSGKLRVASKGVSKIDKAKMQRRGKGRHAFKSKARHKRR